MKEYKLLVVDDAFFVRNLIKKAVLTKPTGFKFEVVGEAKNAEETLDFCKNEECDILTIDYQMPPGEDGVSLIKKLKELYPQKILLMVSDDLSIQKEVEDLNCKFLLKPFKNEVFWYVLDQAIKTNNKANKELKQIQPISEDPSQELAETVIAVKKEENQIQSQKRKRKRKKKKKPQTNDLFGFEIVGSLDSLVTDDVKENTIETAEEDTVSELETVQDEPVLEVVEKASLISETNDQETLTDVTEEMLEEVFEVEEKSDEETECIDTNDKDDECVEIYEGDEDVVMFETEDLSAYEDENIETFEEVEQPVIIETDNEMTEDEELADLIKEASYNFQNNFEKTAPSEVKKSQIDTLSVEDIYVDIDEDITVSEITEPEKDVDQFAEELEKFEQTEVFQNETTENIKNVDEDNLELDLTNIDSLENDFAQEEPMFDDIEDVSFSLNDDNEIKSAAILDLQKDNPEQVQYREEQEISSSNREKFDMDEFIDDMMNDTHESLIAPPIKTYQESKPVELSESRPDGTQIKQNKGIFSNFFNRK